MVTKAPMKCLYLICNATLWLAATVGKREEEAQRREVANLYLVLIADKIKNRLRVGKRKEKEASSVTQDIYSLNELC